MLIDTNDASHSLPPSASPARPLRDRFGICQWFHFGADEDLETAVCLLRELGIRHLRTGVSWADWHRPAGRGWYDRQMDALAEFEILLSVWHTPPSISMGGSCASPPLRLRDYAYFIGELIEAYGETVACVELWNEPNNRYKWDFNRFDPEWRRFGRMTAMAARVATDAGMPTVLGGMMPVDTAWLGLMRDYGAVAAVDAVAIHSFPDMWWDDHPNWDWYTHWHGWEDRLDRVRAEAGGKPVWVTETGLATWDPARESVARHALQCERLEKASGAPADRLYWYSLVDLDPRREAIEGFHVDEHEYHLGLVTYDGERKPAWATLRRLLSEEA